MSQALKLSKPPGELKNKISSENKTIDERLECAYTFVAKEKMNMKKNSAFSFCPHPRQLVSCRLNYGAGQFKKWESLNYGKQKVLLRDLRGLGLEDVQNVRGIFLASTDAFLKKGQSKIIKKGQSKIIRNQRTQRLASLPQSKADKVSFLLSFAGRDSHQKNKLLAYVRGGRIMSAAPAL